MSFCPHFPKLDVLNFKRFGILGGNSMERSSLRFENFYYKVCKVAAQKMEDEEVIQQGSGGYTTRIRRLYKEDQEVMFSDAIIEPLQKPFAYEGCKITAQKEVCVPENFALLAGFFWYCCYYPHWLRDALSSVCGIFFTGQ